MSRTIPLLAVVSGAISALVVAIVFLSHTTQLIEMETTADALRRAGLVQSELVAALEERESSVELAAKVLAERLRQSHDDEVWAWRPGAGPLEALITRDTAIASLRWLMQREGEWQSASEWRRESGHVYRVPISASSHRPDWQPPRGWPLMPGQISIERSSAPEGSGVEAPGSLLLSTPVHDPVSFLPVGLVEAQYELPEVLAKSLAGLSSQQRLVRQVPLHLPPRVFVFPLTTEHPGLAGLVLLVDQPQDGIDVRIQEMQRSGFVVSALLLLSIALASWLLTRRLIRPLRAISTSLEKHAETGQLEGLPLGEPNETGVVAAGVARLYAQSQRLLAQQAEASHASEGRLARVIALLEATLESSVDGLLILDLDGGVLRINQRFLELWPTAPQVRSGDSAASLKAFMGAHLIEPEKLDSAWLEVERRPTETVLDKMVLLDGRVFERTTRAMLVAGEIEGTVCTFRDVTLNIEAERQLVVAKERAEDASRQKAAFLASMSHEIRTPMNGVIGMLNLLLEGQLEGEQRHEAELALSSAEGLLNLINDILDFSKVEAGKLELEKVPFDLRRELGEFAEALALRAEEHDVELVLDVSRLTRTQVLGDPSRIRQILNNLTGNAIKFTRNGYILIEAELRELPDQVRLSVGVKDTGIGIPEHLLDSLFETFTQVDSSTTRKYGGTGLGLAIVKQLCELMSGSVSVTSQLGKGSCFTIDVALDYAEPVPARVPDLLGKRLLVVDDTRVTRDVLLRQLQAWGAEVSGANGIFCALSAFEESQTRPFDVVFVDVELKAQGAARLLRECASLGQCNQTRFVSMTSRMRRPRKGAHLQEGYVATFPKPATAEDLIEALTRAFQNSPALARASSIPSSAEGKPLTSAPRGVARNPRGHELAVEGEPTSGAREAPEQKSSLRLLLVEDNTVNQKVAQGALKRIGYSRADVASNGQEALVTLETSPDHAPYDLVLMDCLMPEMDGYEASARIRKGEVGSRYKEIPIIAMTANAMAGDREKCLQAGMSDYLTKPLNRAALVDVLSKWLPGRDVSNQRLSPGAVAS